MNTNNVFYFLPAFIIAVSVHEYAHAWTATQCGDITPQYFKRLTLNPLAHIDIIGMIALLIFGIGWAKPVPFNYNNFKHRKTYTIITALAGPISNILLATVSLYIANIVYSYVYIHNFFLNLFLCNIMLGCFNILPIPPLDGSHIITIFLEKKHPQIVLFLHRYSLIILLVLFYLPGSKTLLVDIITFVQKIFMSLFVNYEYYK